MTIFLSPDTNAQPAFLFASYGPLANASASSTASGHLAIDVLQPDEANGWKPATTSASFITIDQGSALPCDFLALTGNAIAGTTLSISGSNDNVTFGSDFGLLTIDTNGSCWLQFDQVSYRYLKLSVSGHTSVFQIKHIAVGRLTLLPFFEDGFCSRPILPDGTHLVSHAGLFLGSVTSKVTRPFSLAFGQITPVEEVAFQVWADACVTTPQGFFLVPDTNQEEAHFGYVEKSFKYEPVMKLGLYTIPKIPFISRVV